MPQFFWTITVVTYTEVTVNHAKDCKCSARIHDCRFHLESLLCFLCMFFFF